MLASPRALMWDNLLTRQLVEGNATNGKGFGRPHFFIHFSLADEMKWFYKISVTTEISEIQKGK
jgi:hypothetical protein